MVQRWFLAIKDGAVHGVDITSQAKEGSLRVPFIIRWPGKIPAGKVSNEIVHQMDIYTTLASLTEAKIPDDRIIDGVDHSDFFLGKSEKSNRDDFAVITKSGYYSFAYDGGI